MVFFESPSNELASLPFGLYSLCDNWRQMPTNRPKGLKYHQILWVNKGSGIYRINGDSFVITENDGIFMRANMPHSYEGDNLFTAWCTFFTSEDLFDSLGIGNYTRFSVTPGIRRGIEELVRFAAGKSTLLSRSAAGYSYVTELLELLVSDRESLSDKARALLERRYYEPLSLNGIADELDVDKFALCRKYKQERGITLMEELNGIRIQKAKQLLKFGSDSVEAVGKACGFDSPSYFCLRFRRIVGCTPMEYRQSHK